MSEEDINNLRRRVPVSIVESITTYSLSTHSHLHDRLVCRTRESAQQICGKKLAQRFDSRSPKSKCSHESRRNQVHRTPAVFYCKRDEQNAARPGAGIVDCESIVQVVVCQVQILNQLLPEDSLDGEPSFESAIWSLEIWIGCSYWVNMTTVTTSVNEKFNVFRHAGQFCRLDQRLFTGLTNVLWILPTGR